MKLKFTKMHGCGNDYIFFDCIGGSMIDSPENLCVRVSNRNTGIGGDGIVLMLPPASADANARMRMFNRDGSESAMCGNAIRCVAGYLFDNKIVTNPRMRIETGSGIKELEVIHNNGSAVSVKVNMGNAELRPEKIPVKLPGESIISRPIGIGGVQYRVTCVSMGNPHAVIFVDNVDKLDLRGIGPMFERDSLFPERVSTEIVQVINQNCIKMRVWERGAGETMACGTGACAAAVAAVLNGHCNLCTDIKVKLRGGDLIVNYTNETVIMTGDCNSVFTGEIAI
ncbi:MAG: diaminopimelate epimerase [Defluviitaleaceae bacterium]|nr:diaminopimelate epimerase [Defluviitaleaceae bacterium]